MIFCLAALLLHSTVLTPALGYAKPPLLIPRVVLLRPTERHRAELSPDGRWVAFTTRTEGRNDLWIQSTTAAAEPRRVDTANVKPISWRWTFANDIVVAGVEQRRETLLLIPLEGDPIRVTPFSADRFDLVSLSPNRPTEMVIRARSSEEERSGLFIISLTTLRGRPDPIRLEFDPDVERWWVDRQFRVRAAERRNKLYGHELRRKSDDNSWVTVANYSWSVDRLAGDSRERVVSVSADGQTLYFVDAEDADSPNSDTVRLRECDLRTGMCRVLATAPHADVLWSGATLHPGTDRPQAVVSYGDLQRHTIDDAVAPHFAALSRTLEGHVSFVGRSVDDSRWLVRDLDGGPATYHLYDTTTKTTTRLFSDLPALDPVSLARRAPLLVTARDGLRLPCRLYLPPDADPDGDGVPTTPLPTVLYVHGGPWAGFGANSWGITRHLQLLANRGYAVIDTEFRGAVGYGKSFTDAGDRQWGRAMLNDLVDIADAAADRKIAQKEKTAIFGWSYGGYAANAALTMAPERFACAVSLYGLSDLLAIEKPDQLWKQRVGDPGDPDQVATLRAVSPLYHADAVVRPLLIGHGVLDRRAPCAQSDRFVEALTAAGKTVTYLRFREEGHDFRQDRSWHAFWAVAEQFLHQHLGGRRERLRKEFVDLPMDIVVGIEHIDGLSKAKR